MSSSKRARVQGGAGSAFLAATDFVTASKHYAPVQPPQQEPGTSAPAVGESTGVSGPEAAGGAGAGASARGPLASFPPDVIVVHRNQRGNPLLAHLTACRTAWAGDDAASCALPDYVCGRSTAVVFLSLRYAVLHPDYLDRRLAESRGEVRRFRVRVLLIQCDLADGVATLASVARVALAERLTLLVAWSPREAARYIETFKAYEYRPATGIQERLDDKNATTRAVECLTVIRKVNKSDALTLLNAFGSLAGIARASMEELAACPGIGPTKVRRIHDAFHQPLSPAVAGDGAAEPAHVEGSDAAGVDATAS